MLAAAPALFVGCASFEGASTGTPRETYHGWSGALVLRNDEAEVVVVPEIGRVMSFGFHDENVFWDDPALHGQPVNPE